VSFGAAGVVAASVVGGVAAVGGVGCYASAWILLSKENTARNTENNLGAVHTEISKIKKSLE
jgi:hypothetical protein